VILATLSCIFGGGVIHDFAFTFLVSSLARIPASTSPVPSCCGGIRVSGHGQLRRK
jgi:hypothetical protein